MITLDVPPNYPPPPPPPPPPKKPVRPKITLQIPDAATPVTPRGSSSASVYWGPTRYHGRPPGTAASHISDPNVNPYFNPFLHMYHNKASDFMFKQFAGFKDFTMNTAKSGLSAGEKSAFWFVNKLRLWSKRWFTHLFLTLCLALYSVMGAAIFMALEGPNENSMEVAPHGNNKTNVTEIRSDIAIRLQDTLLRNKILLEDEQFIVFIQGALEDYESILNYTKSLKSGKEWGFWNAMFYTGTIYTTIGLYLDGIIF